MFVSIHCFLNDFVLSFPFSQHRLLTSEISSLCDFIRKSNLKFSKEFIDILLLPFDFRFFFYEEVSFLFTPSREHCSFVSYCFPSYVKRSRSLKSDIVNITWLTIHFSFSEDEISARRKSRINRNRLDRKALFKLIL